MTSPVRAKEGGLWGWLAVGASFVSFALALGSFLTIGIVFDHFMLEFDCTRSQLGAVASVNYSLQCFLAPVASFLQAKFGTARVAIAGSIGCALSFICCSLAQNTLSLLLSFGVLGGISSGLLYLPVYIEISFRFIKWRGLATAFSIMGAFAGGFFQPYVFQYLISVYGWRGALFIIGALIFNSVPACLLLRPVDNEKCRDIESCEKESKQLNEDEKAVSTMLEKSKDIDKCWFENQVATENSKHQPSLNIDSSPANNETYNGKTDNFHETAVFGWMPKALLRSCPGHLSQNKTAIIDSEKKQSSLSTHVIYDPFEFAKLKRKDKDNKQHFHLSGFSTGLFNTSIVNLSYLPAPNISEGNTCSSTTDESAQSDDAEQKLGGHELLSKLSRKQQLSKSAKAILRRLAYFFKNPDYTAFVLSNFFILLVLNVPGLFIVDWGQQLGMESEQTTMLLSFVGVGNVIGRPLTALVADYFAEHRVAFFSLMLIISGVVTMIAPQIPSFYFLSFFVFITSFLLGSTQNLLTPILGDMVSIDELGFAFGILIFIEGAGISIGPPLLGLFTSYTYTFTTAGIFVLISGILVMTPRIFRCCR